MEYKCDVCAYKSYYKFNLKRHQRLKHSNNVVSVNPNVTVHNPIDVLLSNETVENFEVNIPDDIHFVESKIMGSNKCSKCTKIFSSSNNLNKHLKHCKGYIVNPLKCKYCDRMFNNRQNNYKHIKVCKVKDALALLEQNRDKINNTNINNNIQNNNHNLQQNIIINNNRYYSCKEIYDSDLSDDEKYTTIERNDFGKEKIDYITDEEMKKLCVGVNIKDLIDKIHFNDDHPENQNIRRDTNKSLKVLKNNKWRVQPKQLVYDTIEDISKSHLLNYSLNKLINKELDDEQTDNLLFKQELYDSKNKKRGVLLYIDVKLEELLKKRNKEFALENDKKQDLIKNNTRELIEN